MHDTQHEPLPPSPEEETQDTGRIIQVTADILAQAEPGSRNWDPLCLAALEAFPGSTVTHTPGLLMVRPREPRDFLRFRLSEETERTMDAFDMGLPVEPFDLVLEELNVEAFA